VSLYQKVTVTKALYMLSIPCSLNKNFRGTDAGSIHLLYVWQKDKLIKLLAGKPAANPYSEAWWSAKVRSPRVRSNLFGPRTKFCLSFRHLKKHKISLDNVIVYSWHWTYFVNHWLMCKIWEYPCSSFLHCSGTVLSNWFQFMFSNSNKL